MNKHLATYLGLALALGAPWLLAACADDTTQTSNVSGQRCVKDRAPSVYQASSGTTGMPTGAQAENLLTPCFQLTGLGSAENTLAITKDGSVFVAPVFTAEGNGFLSSHDDGKSWDVIVPNQRGGANHGRAQPYLFLDERAQRLLFFTSAALGGSGDGFDLSISDDSGRTFRSVRMGMGTLDWIKPVAAPSMSGAYPSVLYTAAPAPISTPVPLGILSPLHQQVQRSFDGGSSWETVGGEQLSLRPVDHGCPADEWVIYGGGVAASDGTIFYGFRRCTRLGIASSNDQGETWTVSDLPGASLIPYAGILSHIDRINLMDPEPLAIDSDDNLYAIWSDENDVLRYAVSRDKAASWSVPLAISAPDAPHTVFGSMAVKAPGVLALAYYGGDGDKFHAYMAESRDALDEAPTFTSYVVSQDVGPLFSQGFDVGYGVDLLSGGDLLEIVQVKYAPDGDIWAAFVKDMCPGRGNANRCEWDLAAHLNSPYQGAIGHLEHR